MLYRLVLSSKSVCVYHIFLILPGVHTGGGCVQWNLLISGGFQAPTGAVSLFLFVCCFFVWGLSLCVRAVCIFVCLVNLSVYLCVVCLFLCVCCIFVCLANLSVCLCFVCVFVVCMLSERLESWYLLNT